VARWWWEAFAIVLLATAAGGATAFMHPHAPKYGTYRPGDRALTPAEVRRETRPILWIDARTEAEYRAGHIDSALLLNEDSWDEHLFSVVTSWTPDKVVIVYCDGGSCHASQAVAQRLKDELAIDEVYYLEGGYPAWQSAPSP